MNEQAAVILVWGRVGGPDLDVHAYAVDTMARALAVVLQWRHQVTGLLQAARRDPLTGLANRTGFWEVLDGLARERGAPLVAVLYVDLDGFKEVNDRYGHRTGDIILTEAAQRIAAVVRPGDTIARLGGDEFAIVCRELDDADEATAIADRVPGRGESRPWRRPTGWSRWGPASASPPWSWATTCTPTSCSMRPTGPCTRPSGPGAGAGSSPRSAIRPGAAGTLGA